MKALAYSSWTNILYGFIGFVLLSILLYATYTPLDVWIRDFCITGLFLLFFATTFSEIEKMPRNDRHIT